MHPRVQSGPCVFSEGRASRGAALGHWCFCCRPLWGLRRTQAWFSCRGRGVMEGLKYAPGFPGPHLDHSLPVEEALQMAWALLLGEAGCGLTRRVHHGEGGGVGRLGEEGEEPAPGGPVATGMTPSLCGPCSGSLWSELGCVPPTCVPLLGKACHLCIQPLAVWDPDHYPIKPIVSQQPSITRNSRAPRICQEIKRL